MDDSDKTPEQLRKELDTLRRRLMRDDSQHQRLEGLLTSEQRVFGALAAGAPITEVLEILCRVIHTQSVHGLCSILLRSGSTLRLWAAAGLPLGFIQAIHELPIGPRAASCGTAVHHRESIIVKDIARDPVWADYRDLALGHGLKACCSSPIRSTRGRILGTFAMYYRDTRVPSSEDWQLIAAATRWAAVVIKYGRLAKALRRAKQRMQSATVTNLLPRGAFLMGVNDELQRPIQRLVDTVDRLRAAPLHVEQAEEVAALERVATELVALREDLRSFAELETEMSPLAADTFNLPQLLGDVLKALALQAHGQGTALCCYVHPDVPDLLIGDAERLGRIVRNVVRQALTHTTQGEVVVEVERHTLSTAQMAEAAHTSLFYLHLTIHDTRYAGLPHPADLRPEQDASKQGLFLSQQLIERMGGERWVEKSAQQGQTFHFTVACTVPKATGASTRPADLPQVQHAPVLVVDHHPTTCRLLAQLLNHWGMQPTCIAAGKAARAAMEQAYERGKPFALALLDTEMPEMDGWTLAAQIKAAPPLAETAVLMLSPTGLPGEIARSQEVGAGACLVKPVMAPELWDAVRVALKLKSALPVTATASVSLAPAPQAPGLHPVRLQTSAPPEVTKTPPYYRVLLAEDNVVNQTFARQLLEKRGHTVVPVGTGRQALAMLERETFDVVLMDLQMPELGGLEAIEIIREREHTSGGHVPIIALTAHAMPKDRDRCLAAGADAYLVKPIQVRMLLDTIMQVVGTLPAAMETAAVLSESTAVFDQAVALERMEGDLDLLQELAALFLSDYPSLLRALHKALDTGDATLLERAAHTLKGAVENFAAQPAATAALRLELLGRRGDMAEAQSAYTTLKQELDRFASALAAL